MITYFVLKGDGNRTAGCVRLENSRARSSCPCTLLLEDGTAVELSAEETPLPARALGAAVLQGDALAAWGAVPGAELTKAELLCRLRQRKGLDPQPGPETGPALVSEPEPSSPIPSSMPEPASGPVTEPVPTSAPEPDPEPAAAPAPATETEIDADPAPGSEPAPEPSDSAALAADFGLLVRHAGEVYEDILHPPLPDDPQPEDPPVDQRPPSGDWFAEAEGLLTKFRR